MSSPKCRFCESELTHTFCDLGKSPLSNAFLRHDQLEKEEPFFPLHAYVCDACYLVQLEMFEKPEHIFHDYAYFSSYSESWLKHCQKYAEEISDRFGYDEKSQIIEIASNDGYLLKFFKKMGINVLGFEPAENVAETAIEKGIPTRIDFFSTLSASLLAEEGVKADLLIGNNVLAHVPELNDFVKAMKIVLKSNGVITMEFPHLLRLIEENQFDTIYHEHFSYFSFLTVEKIFAHHQLTIFDVDEIPTHGGSLRIYVKHAEDNTKEITDRVKALKKKELKSSLDKIGTYLNFHKKVSSTKKAILEFLISAKKNGKKVVGYGAPAKGNTLLNYCGITNDLMALTVDKSSFKQGQYLPGTHIPIHSPERIKEEKPDFVMILPWNIKDEIVQQMDYIYQWGGKFVIPIPELEVLN